MYYYKENEFNYRDIIKIIAIYSLFIMLLVVNYYIAEFLCNIADIPFNLELSIMSYGFGYELTFISTIIEIGMISYFILKIKKISKKTY